MDPIGDETYREPAPPLPDELKKYAPKDETEEDPVKPRENEKFVDAIDRAIGEERLKTNGSNYTIGRLLQRVADGLLFTEANYGSMDEYLVDRHSYMTATWAYILMSVSTNFPRDAVEKYGVRPLHELLKLKVTALEFKDLMPVDLLEGKHQFTRANGRLITLDFAEQHSVDHLKKLYLFARDAALARAGKLPNGALSETAKQVQEKVKAAAEQVLGTHWKVSERKKEIVIELAADVAHLKQMMKSLSESL